MLSAAQSAGSRMRPTQEELTQKSKSTWDPLCERREQMTELGWSEDRWQPLRWQPLLNR